MSTTEQWPALARWEELTKAEPTPMLQIDRLLTEAQVNELKARFREPSRNFGGVIHL
jgi:hypothetical protein